MISLEINGQSVSAAEGSTVLEAARENGIRVPTLCYHRALGPTGVCRLCIVEAEGPGLERTVIPSCSLTVSNGLVIETETPTLLGLRSHIIALMLSGTTASAALKFLAADSGLQVKKTKTEKTDDCILCGLCVRACTEIIKARALSFEPDATNNHRVVGPVTFDSGKCIGCGTCAALCPVKAIRVEDKGKTRRVILYGKNVKKFSLVACASCGKPYTTQEQIDFILPRIGSLFHETYDPVCPDCSRTRYTLALTGQFPVDQE